MPHRLAGRIRIRATSSLARPSHHAWALHHVNHGSLTCPCQGPGVEDSLLGKSFNIFVIVFTGTTACTLSYNRQVTCVVVFCVFLLEPSYFRRPPIYIYKWMNKRKLGHVQLCNQTTICQSVYPALMTNLDERSATFDNCRQKPKDRSGAIVHH